MAILDAGSAIVLLVLAVGTLVLIHTWMWCPVSGFHTRSHVLTCKTREALGLDLSLTSWSTIVLPLGLNGIFIVDVSTVLAAVLLSTQSQCPVTIKSYEVQAKLHLLAKAPIVEIEFIAILYALVVHVYLFLFHGSLPPLSGCIL